MTAWSGSKQAFPQVFGGHLKEYTTEEIRNIALAGHGGSGKTILSDAILFNAGAITRIGRIEDGSTMSDYRVDEIQRQISINSTLLTAEFGEKKINLFDTPGYTDFIGDVLSCIRVADTVCLLLKAVEGVEVGSELFWKSASAENKPAVVAVNKMDNEHADFDQVIEKAKDRFGHNVIPVQYPVNSGATFSAIIDLLRMKLLQFKTDGSGKYDALDIPADQKDKANAAHEALIEAVAESSETLMNSFFEHGTLTEEELRTGLTRAIAARQIFPAFAVAGEKNIGVTSMLEFFVNYCPSPATIGPVEATNGTENKVLVSPHPGGEPVAFVFKTLSEQHVGELSLFRVYSGAITSGLDLINQNAGKQERINQIYVMRGKERKEVTKLVAGDIGAVVKLKDTHTNNTLSTKSYSVRMNEVVFPEPLITGAIRHKSKGEEDKISTGLHTLHEEDPSFIVRVDQETHETIVLGQGEIHLDTMIRRLKQRFGVDVELGQPRIPYRETIRKKVEVSYKHKKQTGGAGQYGEVYIRMAPKQRGEGYEFVDAIVGGVISNKYIPAVDKGIIEQMAKGVLAGYPVVDIQVELFDGSQHTVDSNEISFKIAAQQAFRKGFREANPVLLEPIYLVEVTVPDEFMGDVMGDISSHRGKIMGMDSEGPFQIIRAKIPLAELYQYATRLRSITQGRGLYKRSFSHYEEVQAEIMNKIIEESQHKHEDE